MGNKETSYEVYVDSIYGSDVLKFTDYKKAIEDAKKWASEIAYKRRVVVVKVEHELVFTVEKEG